MLPLSRLRKYGVNKYMQVMSAKCVAWNSHDLYHEIVLFFKS